MAAAPAFGTNLRSWVYPVRPAEFRRAHWGKKHLFVPGSPARLARLLRGLRSVRIEDLVGACEGPVSAWYVDQGRPDYSLEVTRAIAPRLYRAGLTLYFRLDPKLPMVASLIANTSRELAHAPLRTVLSVFATRRGNHTRPHVDFNENFTVQLTGRKTWRLGPTRMSVTCQMDPGSMLYCPSPWLHETFARDDSISLNLSFQRFSWAEFVAPALRSALEQHPRWKENAFGLWGDAKNQAAGLSHLQSLLGGLGEGLRGLGDLETFFQILKGSAPAAPNTADAEPSTDPIASAVSRSKKRR